MFRVQYRHDVNKVEGFRDESSCPHQYTVLYLLLVTDFDTPKYRLQLAEQICAPFERFDLLLTHQLFMFTDPLASSPSLIHTFQESPLFLPSIVLGTSYFPRG